MQLAEISTLVPLVPGYDVGNRLVPGGSRRGSIFRTFGAEHAAGRRRE